MTEPRLRTAQEPLARDAHDPDQGSLRHRHALPSTMADRLVRPHSREEAEERYVAAREAWTSAMRNAASGRSSDLAALAIAQEAYEAALAERQRWASSPTVALPIRTDRPTGIDAVVGQELSWRRVHQQERAREQAREQAKGRRGLLGRLFRR